MAKEYGNLLTGYGALPVQPPEAGYGVDTFEHCFRQVITLNSNPTTNTILLMRKPAGQLFLRGFLISSVSLGSSVISIGTAAAPAKYRAAAVFTAVNTLTPFGEIALLGVTAPEAADEEVLLTIGTAALPASGTLVVQFVVGKP